MCTDRISRAAWLMGAVLVFLPAASHAGSFTLGPAGGTTGIGLDATVSIGRHAGLRFSHGLMGGQTTLNYHGIPYSFDASLDWLGAFVDLYPSSGPFRISAGGMAVMGNVDVSVSPTEPLSLGGLTYTPDQLGTVTGSVRMLPVVPYLGLGWDSRRAGVLGLSLDIGAAFQKYDLELNQHGGSLPAYLQQALGAGVESERESLEHQMNRIGVYPVVRAGLSVNF